MDELFVRMDLVKLLFDVFVQKIADYSIYEV
jgi:hypothetical protein